MAWPRIDIIRPRTFGPPSGPDVRQGIAPSVISASRATDIPAFYGSWFMERLRAGYCAWKNPFNARQTQFVSFSRCRCLVFWTKNPRPFFPYLAEIQARGYAFYFQYTLNDYEAEGLEPHLPPLAERIAAFCELSDRLGRERVLWRFDPLLLGPKLPAAALLDRLDQLGERLAPYTEKLAFSFLDMYTSTRRGLMRVGAGFRPPSQEEEDELCQGIAERRKRWPKPVTVAACCEGAALARNANAGIERNACVDGALISRISQTSQFSQTSGIWPGIPPGELRSGKDTGQRNACACTPSKDIGAYATCPHLCAYCYANRSEKTVSANLERIRPGTETLL